MKFTTSFTFFCVGLYVLCIVGVNKELKLGLSLLHVSQNYVIRDTRARGHDLSLQITSHY